MSEPTKLWSVTTLISAALGTGRGLVEWNVRTACEAAYDKINTLRAFHEDGDREGAVKWLMDARWTKTGKAAARGIEVHKAAEALALGQQPDIAPEHQGYLDQYRQFLEDYQPEFLMAEAPVYHLGVEGGYAGTLDAVAIIQGTPVVLDIKTTEHGPNATTPSGRPKSRPPYPEVALQLTMYRKAQLVGLLADRRELDRARYYAFDPASQTEPMPHTEGGLCLAISPEDYRLVAIDTSERVWGACRNVLEVARFQIDTSQVVLGPELTPAVPV